MPVKSFFESTVLVTGGTGSFGQVITRQLLDAGARSVRILSRDEAKQDAMRVRFADDRLKFITGDVRDYGTVESSMDAVNYVFHAAALKQVPNCELHPMEAIRTNTLGSENVRLAALRCIPESVVALSTDKACSPINTMGLTKALMERIFLQERHERTRFVCVRYGNVIGSRGSVIPLFREMIRQGKPLPITDPLMTRFLLCIPDAVETALMAALHGLHGYLVVRKMPAATIQTIANAMVSNFDYPMKVVGARPGEKVHETLINEDEMRRATDQGSYFVVGPMRTGTHERDEYTSGNTDRLGVEEVRALISRAEAIE